jgi:hypothetical protein
MTQICVTGPQCVKSEHVVKAYKIFCANGFKEISRVSNL